MSTGQTQEKEITIEGELRWDPLSFSIVIPQPELHKRLKDGDSMEDIVDDLVWDSDYCETESDPYYRERVISRVKG